MTPRPPTRTRHLALAVLALLCLGGITSLPPLGIQARAAEAFDFNAWAKTDRLGLLAGDGKARVEAAKVIGEKANPADILTLVRDINANQSKVGSTMYLIDTLRAASLCASRVKSPAFNKDLVSLLLGECLRGSAVTLAPVRNPDGSRAALPAPEVQQRKNAVVAKAVLPALEQLEKEGALKELRPEVLKALKPLSKEPWLEESNRRGILGWVGSLSIDSP